MLVLEALGNTENLGYYGTKTGEFAAILAGASIVWFLVEFLAVAFLLSLKGKKNIEEDWKDFLSIIDVSSSYVFFKSLYGKAAKFPSFICVLRLVLEEKIEERLRTSGGSKKNIKNNFGERRL